MTTPITSAQHLALAETTHQKIIEAEGKVTSLEDRLTSTLDPTAQARLSQVYRTIDRMTAVRQYHATMATSVALAEAAGTR